MDDGHAEHRTFRTSIVLKVCMKGDRNEHARIYC
jgi:hypothetical protein